jgi:hypothetical protein
MSPDYWSDPSGNQGRFLRPYDFCPSDNARGFNTPWLDMSDPSFQAKYVRYFAEIGHLGMEMETWLNTTYLTNFQTGQRDPIYTSFGGTPYRNDGWLLSPETHYPQGQPCPALPDLTFVGLQVYETFQGVNAWQTPGTGATSASQITYGDCFVAGSPGAYYEPMWTSLPDYGSLTVHSIGP